MNIVNKLTLRHMKENKRRTMVTIIGVIISVAMVMSVATLFVSFLDLMKRHEIADNGEWHVMYGNVDKEQLEAIRNDDATKSVILSRDVGYAFLDGGQNETKPYLFFKEYNDLGFKKIPIELIKGRLPKAANEVVLSEHIATNGKVHYKIGDVLKVEVGDRIVPMNGDIVKFNQQTPLQTVDGKPTESIKNREQKIYKITGIIKRPTWELPWAPGYTVLSYVNENMMGANSQVDASVIVKNVNPSIYEHANALAKKNGIKSVEFNNTLLRLYGVTSNEGLGQTLLWLSAIIVGIIVIGSVALIYNAFAISVSERARHLGMLASVGATKRQKRNSVFFEGIVIGLISIPLGIAVGIGGMGITIWLINSIIQDAFDFNEKLKLTVTLYSVLTACAVSILTIFISIYLPARKASRVSAIDAIRQTAEVKLTGKNVKTSKMVRKLFGFEAEIGLKNLKRNKRRYQATVFSLVISIVLFLSVSYFTADLRKSITLTQDNSGYDIQVVRNGKITVEDERIFQSMAALDGVTSANSVSVANAQSWIDRNSVADEFKKEVFKNQFQNGKMAYIINLHALDEQSLKAYAKKVGVQYSSLIDRNHLAGIVIDKISYREGEFGKYIETKAIQAKIDQSLGLRDINTEQAEDFGKITIAGLTDQLPMGVYVSGIGNLTVIISKPVLEQLVQGHPGIDVFSNLYLKSNDPLKTQDEIDKIKSSNMSVYNVYKNRQQSEQMIMMMSVFTYGFIALITLISIANIFNTISTSISLRKREFAMLKSVGMTPKGFNKMINYESIFYGIKSLLYGLPISIGVMYLIYLAMMNSFRFGFVLPWLHISFCLAAVFVIVGSAMLYSSAKVKKENIIDALKQESI